jgi:hypothetical protein
MVMLLGQLLIQMLVLLVLWELPKQFLLLLVLLGLQVLLGKLELQLLGKPVQLERLLGIIRLVKRV